MTSMTSMTRQYTATAAQAGNAVEKTADLWAQGMRKLVDRTYLRLRLPQVDLIPAVERYFDFVQHAVDMNRDLTVRWVKAAGALSGAVRAEAETAGSTVRERAESAGSAVRERAESAGSAVRERAESAGSAVRERAESAGSAVRAKADRVEQAAHEQASQAARVRAKQAEQAEQAEKDLAREARKVERAQARQAGELARKRYEGLTKAQLSDLLAERELPKSGNVDDLIERLVEADTR